MDRSSRSTERRGSFSCCECDSSAAECVAGWRPGALNVETFFRSPSGFLPVAMSSIAFFLVLAHVATVGVAPQADEGAEAHLWHLLMVAELPLIAYFGVRWVPHAPKQGLIVLLTQLVFALVAATPVFLLGF
jgi:hypothetical protein